MVFYDVGSFAFDETVERMEGDPASPYAAVKFQNVHSMHVDDQYASTPHPHPQREVKAENGNAELGCKQQENQKKRPHPMVVEDEEAKIQRRKLQNRRAAQASRDKRKKYVQDLEERFDQATRENQLLRVTLASVQGELRQHQELLRGFCEMQEQGLLLPQEERCLQKGRQRQQQQPCPGNSVTSKNSAATPSVSALSVVTPSFDRLSFGGECLTPLNLTTPTITSSHEGRKSLLSPFSIGFSASRFDLG